MRARTLPAVGIAIALTFLVISGAMAKGPSEKATGEVGYTAFRLQRWAEFNAHEGKDGCYWNLEGVWSYTAHLGSSSYSHDMTIEQSNGTLTGTGGYPSPGPYSIVWEMLGTTADSSASWTVTYPSGYNADIEADIAPDGTMSGSWKDSSGKAGTWSSFSGSATLVCGGKGEFHYSDANGNWYDVDVQYVNVVDNQAYFAGPVVLASNTGWVGNWVSAAVKDGGEPAYLVDSIWGIFTDMATARSNVVGQVTPDGEFVITSGNLQVHTYD